MRDTGGMQVHIILRRISREGMIEQCDESRKRCQSEACEERDTGGMQGPRGNERTMRKLDSLLCFRSLAMRHR